MKKTRDELLKLWKVFDNFKQNNFSPKFVYFIVKNKSKLKDNLEVLQASGKIPDEYKIYDQKRSELAKLYSDKDANGKPIIIDKNYKITEKIKEFEDEILKLKLEYKELIEETQRNINTYTEKLKEKVEFEGYKINIIELPSSGIDVETMEILMECDLIIDN